DGSPYTIIGVMAPGFDYPDGAAAWTPFGPVLERGRLSRWGCCTTALVKLKPGISLEKANAELTRLGAALIRAYPADNEGWHVSAVSLRDYALGVSGKTADFVMGAVLLTILLVTTVLSVALLAVARDLERIREFS